MAKTVAKCAFVVLVVVLLVEAPALGQVFEKGAIRGTVYDPSGAVVPGATVKIVNLNTGLTREVETNEEGRYSATLLPAARYRVEITAAGFRTAVVREVNVAVGQEVVQNFTLELGPRGEEVVVQAQADPVDESDPLAKTRINETYVERLPISQRDFREFANLSGTADTSPGLRSPVRLGGQRGAQTGLQIDGVDNRNSFFGEWFGSLETKNFSYPQDAVQEFEVRDSSFSAEFGHATGGLINVVTKSGTNEWHGSVHWFFQTNSLIANTSVPEGPQADISIPPSLNTRHQFGGTIGGPIVKDKAFFFFAMDNQQQKGPLTGRFAIDVNSAPCPCPLDDMPGLAGETLGSLEGQTAQRQDLWAPLIRFDWNITENNTATTRFNYTRNETDAFTGFSGSQVFVSGAVPNNFENFVNDGFQFNQTLTSVLSPVSVNEFRLAITREMRPRRQRGPGPGVIMFGAGAFNQALFLPIDSDHRRFQFVDNFSRTFGKHDVKLGVDVNFNRNDQIFIGFEAGEYFFGDLNGNGSPLDEFVARTPLFLLQLVGLQGNTATQSGTVPTFTQTELAFYVQDNWRIHPRLVLNLGLRWNGTWNPTPQFTPFPPNAADVMVPVGEPQVDVAGNSVQLDLAPVPQGIPDDFDNWGPRVGAAWDVTGKGTTVVRGGVGLYYAPMPSIFMADMLAGVGRRGAVAFIPFFGSPTDLTGLGLTFPDTLPPVASPAVQALLGPPGIRYADPDMENVRSINFQIGAEHEIVRDLSISGTYTHIRTENLRTGGFFSTRYDRNVDPTGVTFDQFGRTVGGFNQPKIDPTIDFADSLSTFGKQRYHAFLLQVQKTFSDNYQFGMNYTVSRNEDNATTDRDTDAFLGPSDPFNFQELDFGRSQLDIRHQFSAYGTAVIPVIDVWISSIIRARSGRAMPVVGEGCGAAIGVTIRSGSQCSGPANDFNQRRPVVDGELLPRFPFRNGNFFNWDVRFGRDFNVVAERARVRFTFEIFNVTDAKNVFTATTGNAGTNPVLGSPTFKQKDQVGSPISAQFGLKFLF